MEELRPLLLLLLAFLVGVYASGGGEKVGQRFHQWWTKRGQTKSSEAKPFSLQPTLETLLADEWQRGCDRLLHISDRLAHLGNLLLLKRPGLEESVTEYETVRDKLTGENIVRAGDKLSKNVESGMKDYTSIMQLTEQLWIEGRDVLRLLRHCFEERERHGYINEENRKLLEGAEQQFHEVGTRLGWVELKDKEANQ